MSTVATAKAYPITGPLPRAPRYSLLSVMQEIQDAQWQRGVAVEPYPPGVPTAIDTCVDLEGTMATKTTPDGVAIPDDFPVFMGYLGNICTAMSIGETWAAWQDRVNAAFMARRSWLLERQLMNGSFVTAPYMGDTDANVVSGALASRVALAQLEALGAQTGQEYWIHMPPEVAAHLGYERLRDDRGILRTATGAPVVVGQGYSQDDNTSGTDVGEPPVGELAAGDRKSWIYVTGPVMGRVADTVFLNPETMSEGRDWQQNTVVYRAEQAMVVAWDKQLQGAALADWSGS